MAQKRDYYEILGIDRSSSGEVIKSAYRKLAMKYHPDRNPGDQQAEDHFKEAAEAYSILSDQEKRTVYDQHGHAGLGGLGQGGGFNPADFSDFSDIFGDFFGFGDLFGGRQRKGPRRGSDLQYELEIEFEDAAFGMSTDIQFPRTEACKPCSGSGSAAGSRARTCPTCGGRGQVYYQQGFFSVGRTCSGCSGSGQIIDSPCQECHGTGQTKTERKLKINIPAGVDTGTRLRLTGEGESGAKGGPPGDLYVLLRVKEHELFERDASDLHCEVPVNVAQAALGAEITVPTLEGEATVRLDAGSQSGSHAKLRGKGVPSVNNGRRGDLIVHFRVVVPEKLSREQREIFESLLEALPVDNEPSEKDFLGKVKDYFS